MKLTKPGNIFGSTTAPASKSMMQRFVALSCLASSPTTIHNPSDCDDSLASLSIAKGLGASITTDAGGSISITPGTPLFPAKLDCGESGTSFRIFSGLAALFDKPITVTGSGSLMRRTMQMIVDSLSTAGVHVVTQEGFPPLTITGPFKQNHIIVDGSITSQYLSGLLIALPHHTQDTTIEVSRVVSRPYIQMTLNALKDFDITILHNQELTNFSIPGNQKPRGQQVTIEGDWSSASFLLVAAAMTGTMTVAGLDPASTQADRAIMHVLDATGATYTWDNDVVTVSKPTKPLQAFQFDATDCPDLFPPLVALATACEGTSKIYGTDRLVAKESNRAAALIEEFKKFGYDIREEHQTLIVEGKAPLTPTCPIDPHKDHRIAMAAAITALRCPAPVEIGSPEVVQKSFPNFFEVLEKNSQNRG